MATLRTLIEHQTAYAEDCNFNFNALNNESATTTQAVSTLSSTVGGHTTSINTINGNISTINDNISTINGNIETINTKIANNTPVGTIIWFAGDNVPTGCLLCDGTAKSRTDYDDLFEVIGITYGAGDGSTTFNLPNFVNKIPAGSSTPGSVNEISTPSGGSHFHTSFVGDGTGATGTGGSSHTHKLPSLTLLPCIKY